MKKTSTILISLLVILGIAFYVFVYPKLEIVSGYNAKILCSCVFVQGLNQELAEDVDLNYSLLGLATNRVDRDKKEVHSSVWGMHSKVAVYREGLGCTLINEIPRENLKAHNPKSRLTYAPDIWPDKDISPDENLAKAIQKAFDEKGEKKKNTRAIVVVKDGEIIGEAYGDGMDRKTPLLGWSMTKSITASLAGILVREGNWALDAPIPVDEWENDSRGIELQHLLRMASGLKWNEDYGTDSKITLMLYTKGCMGCFAADVPMAAEAGEVWNYSSGTTNIIAKAMESEFSDWEAYVDFPYERLFGPLGMNSFVMETDASGHFVGSSYSYATARDWAKLGLLYLNMGNWEGEQIIDSAWVDFVRSPAAASEGEYGGHFWLNQSGKFEKYDESAYWMGGYHGQQVSIHPEENMVIVRLGVTYDKEDFDFSEIIGGIVEAAMEK